MLHSFTCENCYSFAEKSTIEMVVSKNTKNTMSHDGVSNGLEPTKRGGTHVWQFASIYGANASGKSTFLKALSSIFHNIAGNSPNRLFGERFLYDDDLCKNPIFCNMRFSLKKPNSADEYVEYEYAYELETYVRVEDKDKNENENEGKAKSVLYEYLLMRDLTEDIDIKSDEGFKLVFERGKTNYEEHRAKFDELDFKEENGIKFGKDISEDTRNKLRPNEQTLVMRLFGGDKYEEYGENKFDDKIVEEPFGSIFEWCEKTLAMHIFGEREGEWQLGSAADRGCYMDLEQQEKECQKRAAKRFKGDKEFRKSLISFIKDLDEAVFDITLNEKDEFVFHHEIQNAVDKEGNPKQKQRLIFKESYGTQKMSGMYQYFYDVRKGKRWLLIIDEFDIKLHPWIFLDIIEELREECKEAQIIFSAHSLSAFNSKIMHMDEIHLVEKQDGKSNIKRLNNDCFFDDDERQNFSSLYLGDAFGGTPSRKVQIIRSD